MTRHAHWKDINGDDPESYRSVNPGSLDLGPLFDRAVPFAPGSDTSEAAALSILPVVSGLRFKVLQALDRPDGRICDEIEADLNLKHQTAAARLWELAGKNRRHPLPALIYASTARRPTRSGCLAQVYQLTDLGREVLRAYRARGEAA